MYTEELIKIYDRYWEPLKIAPIAHTKIMSDFVILLDANGYKMSAEVHKYVPVPCTVESETRTANVAPHLLHDNIAYVANFPGHEKHHKVYMNQLYNYVKRSGDLAAKVIYDYVSGGTVINDLIPVMEKAKKNIKKPFAKINVVFLVYPSIDTINLRWTDYYVNSLPKNGICMATGQPDFIPKAYPAKIRSNTDFAKLFVDGSNVGYIASQKIIHTLQVLVSGNEEEMMDEIEGQEITNWNINP